MSKLVGAGEQQRHDYLYDASGVIVTGGTPQLLLPQHQSRSYFLFVNNSTDTMYLDFGCGYAHATLTNGVVSLVSIDNAGFNFTKPPLIRFLGGGAPQGSAGYSPGPNTSYVGGAGPGFPAPQNIAQAHATLSASAIAGNLINSIVVDNGGAGYITPPYVQIIASDLDPNGVVIAGASYPNSIAVLPNGGLAFEATVCSTDAVSVVGANNGDAFTCKFMT